MSSPGIFLANRSKSCSHLILAKYTFATSAPGLPSGSGGRAMDSQAFQQVSRLKLIHKLLILYAIVQGGGFGASGTEWGQVC